MLVQARAPKPSAFYDGLETSRAFARVHPPPDERRAYVSRPDLDAVASQAAHARYQRGLEDDRAARALFMHRRRTQRELLARQDAELRELEASLRTPYQRALERRAREAAAAAEAERLDTPQFADAQRLAQALAAAMVKARGVRGQNSGVRSTQLRDRQLHAAPPPGDSRLLHAPSLAHPTPNALAAARVNDRVATMRTNGAARPLGLGQLHALIAHMLEEKIQADAVDDAMRNERQSLAEFVSDELWRRYGLKELAQRHAANLLASAVGMAAQSGRVRLFAAAMGWIDGEGAWTAAKQNFCLGLIALLFEPSAVRERLSRHGEVWLSLPQLRAAVRAMFYSRALEERLLAQLEALSVEDPSGALLSGRRVSLDAALLLLAQQFDAEWDTVVSHIHRPTYAQDQLFLSRGAGHYTQQAREAAGKIDVLPSSYKADFYQSSTDRLVAEQQRPGSHRPSVFADVDARRLSPPGSAVSSARGSRRPSVFYVANIL